MLLSAKEVAAIILKNRRKKEETVIAEVDKIIKELIARADENNDVTYLYTPKNIQNWPDVRSKLLALGYDVQYGPFSDTVFVGVRA